ncbi:uncharacterized protein LOC141797899 [Halichoeres trimaculatus]|uniref:uncharacterized protein LOC141797899 n=1 Tax=Halichoeres trimaculatus TaxID=147232 RepID=UPI003D9FA493
MFLCHFLLMGVSLQVAVAMPEPPLQAPPTPMYPPMVGPGRILDSEGENMTEPLPEDLETYCQMLQQAPVPPDHLPWFCMCTQCQSSPGPKGDQGERGLPGRPGSPGRRGMTGFRGPPGFVGRPGIKGQKGDEGEKGERGPQGFMGPKGGRGFKGDKGEQGLEGRPGDQGPKGDEGVCPSACDSISVLPGPPGPTGLSGPRGLPGSPGLTGPKGEKGDMGNVGAPGAPGSVGEKGDLGPQGECNCTDGEEGAPGQKGDKGDKGEQGKVGVTGQQGPQGDKGDMGHMGMMGPPGPCMPSIQSAFAAGLTSSFPPPDTPVVFSNVIYNTQGSYDPTTGLYIAPINGTYVFSYHLTVHERVLKVGLFHNFRPVVITTDTKILGTTSHSVILHLALGDRVWIQVKDSVTNGMYSSSETSSTFSGFLLHPDSCDMATLRGPFPHMDPPRGEYSWGSVPGSQPPPTGGSD